MRRMSRQGHAALTADHPGRFLLGLGVSHAPAVERANQQYVKPFSKMVDYLDQLDAASPPVPHGEEVLAALGPRMLALAAQRTAGAHPYFVPPEHTALARKTLGDGPLLATEQMVVLDTDPSSARSTARENISRYLALPNYTNNLRAASASLTPTWPPPAPTASSTPSSRGAIRTAIADASTHTTTQAQITCVCRCCSLIPPRSPAPNGEPSPPLSSPRTDPRETPPMKYTHLGRTGLSVSRICLGTMNFGPQTDEAESDLIMDRAIDEGINFFDTANVYGFGDRKGWTEEIIGRWFARAAPPREDGHRDEALRQHAALAERQRSVGPQHPPRLRGVAASAADRLHRPVPDAPRRPGDAVGRDLAGDGDARRSRARSSTWARRTSPAGTW